MASPMVRRALPALVNPAVKALCIAALISLAICVFVIVLIAVGRDVPAISMPEIVALGGTKAVSRAPVNRAITNPVLIAVLSRRIQAIAAAISATSPASVAIPISVAVPVIAVIAANFTESALIS